MLKSKGHVEIYAYVPFVLFFLYAFWIHKPIGLAVGDDFVYQNTFNEYDSVVSWIKSFYLSWGGRVPIQLMDIVFLNLPLIIWKMYNSILYLMLMIGICLLEECLYPELSVQGKCLRRCITALLILVLPSQIVSTSVTWITGSFNYLLPGTMLLYAIYPYICMVKREKLQKWELILGFIGAFFAAYEEQTAAIYSCIGLFCCGYYVVCKKRKPLTSIMILYLFGMVNVAIQYLAPGNQVRSTAETLCWYPDYDMFSTMDKMVLGMIHTLKYIFNNAAIYLIVLAIILGSIAFKREKIYRVIYMLIIALTTVVRNVLNNMADAPVVEIYNIQLLMQIALFILWIILCGILICDTMRYSFDGWIMGLSFWALFASGIVVGMSPTIFGSGDRIFFNSFLVLLMLLGIASANLVQLLEYKDKDDMMQKDEVNTL